MSKCTVVQDNAQTSNMSIQRQPLQELPPPWNQRQFPQQWNSIPPQEISYNSMWNQNPAYYNQIQTNPWSHMRQDNQTMNFTCGNPHQIQNTYPMMKSFPVMPRNESDNVQQRESSLNLAESFNHSVDSPNSPSILDISTTSVISMACSVINGGEDECPAEGDTSILSVGGPADIEPDSNGVCIHCLRKDKEIQDLRSEILHLKAQGNYMYLFSEFIKYMYSLVMTQWSKFSKNDVHALHKIAKRWPIQFPKYIK